MSVYDLLFPNSFNLYCNKIQTSTDTYDVVTKVVRIFSNTNVDIFGSNINLKYVVRNGICYMWLPTTSTVTLPTNNLNYTSIYIAESSGGYVTIPCPDTSGEKIFYPINIKTQGTTINKIGIMEVDCNTGGTDTQGRLIITLNGEVGITGTGTSPDPYVYTLVPGSNLFNRDLAVYGFSICYPVEGKI